jgi:hypothetical protein
LNQRSTQDRAGMKISLGKGAKAQGTEMNSSLPSYPSVQAGALAARIAVCAGNAGQDAHRA